MIYLRWYIYLKLQELLRLFEGSLNNILCFCKYKETVIEVEFQK